jgi:hypothetical protein
MKPGDMIEWVYKFNKSPVLSSEELWSTPMQRWVPIGKPALLVGLTFEQYFWLLPKGLFHARVNDIRRRGRRRDWVAVVPRARG